LVGDDCHVVRPMLGVIDEVGGGLETQVVVSYGSYLFIGGT